MSHAYIFYKTEKERGGGVYHLLKTAALEIVLCPINY